MAKLPAIVLATVTTIIAGCNAADSARDEPAATAAEGASREDLDLRGRTFRSAERWYVGRGNELRFSSENDTVTLAAPCTGARCASDAAFKRRYGLHRTGSRIDFTAVHGAGNPDAWWAEIAADGSIVAHFDGDEVVTFSDPPPASAEPDLLVFLCDEEGSRVELDLSHQAYRLLVTGPDGYPYEGQTAQGMFPWYGRAIYTCFAPSHCNETFSISRDLTQLEWGRKRCRRVEP